MQFILKKEMLSAVPCDMVVLPWTEGKRMPTATGLEYHGTLKKVIDEIIKEERFAGAEGQLLAFRTLGLLPARQVLIIGLGSARMIQGETLRRAAGRIIKYARECGAEHVAVPYIFGNQHASARAGIRAFVEGSMLAGYRFGKFKSKEKLPQKKKEVQTVFFVTNDARHDKAIKQGIDDGCITAEATIMARDLVNEPALHLTPAALAEQAEAIAAKSKGKIKIKRFGKAELKHMGAGGVLGVAMGSDHPPELVHLVWKPHGARKRIALVGKAITFDSGGLSLKPSDGMVTMKCDMSGAAAVLGVFSALPRLRPNVEVHGIFAACENMPSGTAIRPGDVVKTISGKTIEILNTDAEGRVTLADTLVYATKLKADHIIDIATLTGACVVALGEEIAGLMTNDEHLGGKLKTAAQSAGEELWELPLPKQYEELIVSKVADVKNIGGRWGGALTAGLFLKAFVNDASWAHLDIAGPAYAERETLPYQPFGGTGFAVRTLIEFLKMV